MAKYSPIMYLVAIYQIYMVEFDDYVHQVIGDTSITHASDSRIGGVLQRGIVYST